MGQTQQKTVGLEEHEVKNAPVKKRPVWNREDGFGTSSEKFGLSLNLERGLWSSARPSSGLKRQGDPFPANAAEFSSAGDGCCLGPLLANCSRFPAPEKLRLHQLSEPFRAAFFTVWENTASTFRHAGLVLVSTAAAGMMLRLKENISDQT